MSGEVQVVLIAAGSTGAVGAIGIGAIWLLRRAPLRLSLMAASAIAVLAVVAGTMGSANAMFISHHDLRVVGTVCVVAGLVGLAISWLLGRQVEMSSLALRQAARSLGQEGSGYRPPAGPMAAELAALSRELAATADKLAQSREREQRIEKSRRQLVAWVSHDLRTPLAGLKAMAEALQDGIAADPARYHKQIQAEASRLSAMVEDLFELSRIQSGTLSLAVDLVEVGDLVSDTVASMEPLARARGVQLAGQAVGSPLIRADARELSRALANLVTNAIRHTPEHGRVLVAATVQGGGGDAGGEGGGDAGGGGGGDAGGEGGGDAGGERTVLMTVADGCGGIPEADLASVFETGWRGSAARTPGADGGAGLGLAIVQGIVEAHHGQVGVVNAGEGCRFEIRLPALAPDDDKVACTRPAARSASSDVPGRAGWDNRHGDLQDRR